MFVVGGRCLCVCVCWLLARAVQPPHTHQRTPTPKHPPPNTGKGEKLKGFELVKGVHLEPEPFGVEEGLMTPSFKLKRPQLLAKYQAVVDKLYADLKAAARK